MTSSPIQHQTIQLVATQIEKTTSLEQILTPFALDETIIRHLTKEQTGPFVHFWTLEDIIILGMTDTKVPFLEEGLDRLRSHGFTPIVRQAGGLAVVSNEGILNISLLFKNEQMPTINQAYEWMQQLIQQSFPESTSLGGINAFEVSDSYCPGDYDLSIQGRKIAGIAQRRLKDVVCVSIYLSVFGDQHYRGQVVRDFYDHAIQGQETKWHFPTVNADSMWNIGDALGLSLTIEEVQIRVLQALTQMGCSLEETKIDFTLTPEFQKALERFIQRQ